MWYAKQDIQDLMCISRWLFRDQEFERYSDERMPTVTVVQLIIKDQV
ncbi:hypothetical protein SLEP1_g53011 [Rubroshorea leprosula]|uniref:Uncharacterized protein n=1 Tax=Rubroshorea leprosula TaxID=152421 RepID=A0AAV5MBX2_9ROSI|nr:hypothetical protein SLEP1_g53011 [Rubroshorea leprosula]